MRIEEELTTRARRVPPHQSEVPDPIFFAKLYWTIGKPRWFIAEYNCRTGVAYGFVVGVGLDEWGHFTIPELLASTLSGIEPIRLESRFKPARASTLGIPQNVRH